MACLVMAIIIFLALFFGAGLGAKVNGAPRATTRGRIGTSSSCSMLRIIRTPGFMQTGDDRRPDARDDPAVPAAVL